MSDLENSNIDSSHSHESRFCCWLWCILAVILFSVLVLSALAYTASLNSDISISGLWSSLASVKYSAVEALNNLSSAEMPRSRNDTDRPALPLQLLKRRSEMVKISRKLITTGMGKGHVDRVGDGCSMEDIAIFQGETGPMPNGIPSYTVQIFNLCFSGCPIKDIHVSCGWFASATLVNPKLFKRVRYDDCVVNNGKPLAAGQSLTFQYANSFQYPFSIANAEYECPH